MSITAPTPNGIARMKMLTVLVSLLVLSGCIQDRSVRLINPRMQLDAEILRELQNGGVVIQREGETVVLLIDTNLKEKLVTLSQALAKQMEAQAAKIAVLDPQDEGAAKAALLEMSLLGKKFDRVMVILAHVSPSDF